MREDDICMTHKKKTVVSLPETSWRVNKGRAGVESLKRNSRVVRDRDKKKNMNRSELFKKDRRLASTFKMSWLRS